MPVSKGEVVSMYNEAMQQAHPTLALPMYDLLRYCLKLRSDVPASTRKAGLGACAECIKQIVNRPTTPPPLTTSTDILLELFP